VYARVLVPPNIYIYTYISKLYIYIYIYIYMYTTHTQHTVTVKEEQGGSIRVPDRARLDISP
jgi:hypothetical protein